MSASSVLELARIGLLGEVVVEIAARDPAAVGACLLWTTVPTDRALAGWAVAP